MNSLLSLLGRIPGAAKLVTVLIIVLGLLALVYRRFGLVPTLVLAAGCLLVFLCVWLFRKISKRQERQKGLAFGKALDSAHSGPSREEIQVATEELGQKWREAQENLRKANIDIYQLPWYMLIGEPQSGKSTTLKFSGMRFPVGQEAISGGGGTRNCDWWFTEEGVILDTAGRFTFHEQSRTDSTEWDLFLDMLARHRPFCPINGVILVIPTDALLGSDKTEMEKKAQNISKQLLQIQRRLAIQFPVYVMITKCDKVFGFVQFFNKLTPDQQREMFGWSNPEENTGFDTSTFEHSFGELHHRVTHIRLQHFSQPQYLDDPDQIYTFAEEFESLRDPLRQYMEIIFKPSVYKDPLFFRGYYFCSGMQQGQPIVSACRNMLPNNQIMAKLEDIFNKSRAFFVRDFYSAKVFPEEGLVKRAQAFERKDSWKRRLVWGVNILLLVLGGLFMWGLSRDLNERLSKPMNAIDQAVEELGKTKGTFFSTDADRLVVFQQLKNLHNGLTPGEGSALFGLFQGDRNAMTEPLDDTFAYIYLDRFLLDMFRETQEQVRAYKLARPALPRNSANELDLLLGALKELKRWQVRVHEGDSGDFDPSIEPFLGLVLNPQWDKDLAAYRSDKSLQEELDLWFKHVYERSSASVKTFLIKELVRQSDGLYENLSQKVVQFYTNQPELGNYNRKRVLQQEWDLAYGGLAQPSPTWEMHHQKMVEAALFFSEENQALMGGVDGYLSFAKIREETIKALGPEFVVMYTKSEADGKATTASKFFENPEGERKKVPAAITFVNQLIAVDERTLPNPRGIEEGAEASAGYSQVALDFWEQILKPYLAEFEATPSPYQGSVELGSMLEIGSKRITTLTTLLQTNLLKHVQLLTDQNQQTQITRSFSGFYDARVGYEQEQVSASLSQFLSGQQIGLESPPRTWPGLVSKIREKTSSGSDFKWFVGGPETAFRTLKDNHELAIRNIFFNTEKPYDLIEAYMAQVQQKAKVFYDAVMELNALAPEVLVRDKASYADHVPRQSDIISISDISKTPSYLERHRLDLREWSDAALTDFRSHGKAVDPCPNCASEAKTLREAIFEAGKGFPMYYSGVTQAQPDANGILVVAANLSDPDKVKKVISALEIYRNPTPVQKDFLKKRGVLPQLEKAFAWADGVSAIEKVTPKFRLQLNHVDVAGETRSIADEFTYVQLDGAWTTVQKVLINTPKLTAISPNPNAANEMMELNFFNDDTGNRTEAHVQFKNLTAFLAFALEGSTKNQQLFARNVSIHLNTGGRKVTSGFQLESSVPLPPPPDWGQF